MKSQKSIHRKAAKSKARRRDYEKRRRINRNVPTVKTIEERPTYRPIMVEVPGKYGEAPVRRQRMQSGQAMLERAGTKKIVVKTKRYRRHQPDRPDKPLAGGHGNLEGMIQYPARRQMIALSPDARLQMLVTRRMTKYSDLSKKIATEQVLDHNPKLAKTLEKLKAKK